jgi:hypothetical protein
MLFAPGLARLFSTHPPLAERIRALDAGFDPRTLPRRAAAIEEPADLAALLHVDAVASQATGAVTGASVAADPQRIA